MDGTAAGASQLQDSVEPRFLAAACPRHRHCLQVLIHLLITEPVLRTPDPTRPFAIMTDASQYAMGCVLMQQASEDPSSLWHPVAYHSSKYAPWAGEPLASSLPSLDSPGIERVVWWIRHSLRSKQGYLLTVNLPICLKINMALARAR